MATKLVKIQDLSPGAVLGEAVLTASGKTLLGKDIVLTEKVIALLLAWDVRDVPINIAEDSQSGEEAGQAASIFNGETELSQDYLKFLQDYDSLVTMTAQSFDFIRRQRLVPLQYLQGVADDICATVLTGPAAVTDYLLMGDHKVADAISRHSVMVAYLSGIIARRLGQGTDDVRGVILSALLHDIGKLSITKAEAARPQAHIAEGAALLKNMRGLSRDVVAGVLQHHENIDGSGFPTGVNGLRIHPYARIIAVADIFHNQAYAGEYSNPFPVLELLSQEMFGKLDPSVCHVFISLVRDCLLRAKVLLSDSREAEVIYFHPTGSSLPLVRTSDDKIVDLAAFGSVRVRSLAMNNCRPA